MSIPNRQSTLAPSSTRCPGRLTITHLVIIGYAAMFIGVLALGGLGILRMQALDQTNQDLYRHPFAVSNAAADLKIALLSVRSRMLEAFFMRESDARIRAEAVNFQAEDDRIERDLQVIRSFFLGEMAQVTEIEHRVQHWDHTRSDAIATWTAGDAQGAQELIRTRGTDDFTRLVVSVDKVLAYAKRKAKHFRTEAQDAAYQAVLEVAVLAVSVLSLLVATAAFVLWRVRRLQHELDRRASTDGLTGVANRSHFMELAELEFQRSMRYHGTFALAVVDLDWFKRINDSYGHHTGDAALRLFCTLCRDELRTYDVIGRIGGEEFAVLLPNTQINEAKDILERLRTRVAQSDLLCDNGQAIRITASFGLTAFSPTQQSLEATIKLADSALYDAKANGRNRLCRALDAA